MKPWPHGPFHCRLDKGLVFATAATYNKLPRLSGPREKDLVVESLQHYATADGWTLHAYVVLSNHYHILLHRCEEGRPISDFFRRLHSYIGQQINLLQGTPGNKVWQQYWDTTITFEASYMARLNYIHRNPVHHGVVQDPRDYRWSSLHWFMETAPLAFVQSVENMPTDNLNIPDNF